MRIRSINALDGSAFRLKKYPKKEDDEGTLVIKNRINKINTTTYVESDCFRFENLRR